jgi:hypothetical protein
MINLKEPVSNICRTAAVQYEVACSKGMEMLFLLLDGVLRPTFNSGNNLPPMQRNWLLLVHIVG